MSKILNLKEYELVFTTSFFYTHGVSGHLYEMIDYYYICRLHNIKCAVLLADGITKEIFTTAILDKYNFTEAELWDILSNTFECYRPRIIMANNVCIVDGSWRILNCVLYAENVFLLRCSEGDFSYFHNNKTIKRTHLMQDFKLYPERFDDLNIEVVDYVKKILWGKYHTPRPVKTNTALLYLTTSMRATSAENIQKIIDEDICENYLIVTNNVDLYRSLERPNVVVRQAPIKDIFEKFDTYIYTPTKWQIDCSPRFIVECAVYNKDVVYKIDYECKGIDRRKEDIQSNLDSLELTPDDFFISYVKQQLT